MNDNYTKQCGTCKEVLGASFFHRNKARRDGLVSICKSCAKTKALKHYHDNPGHRWKLEIKRKYGITAEQYDQMLEAQGGACKICKTVGPGGSGRTSRMAVDHCHETGKVRGILCNKCNRAIGLLGDNVAILRAAITYLEEHHDQTQHPSEAND